MRKKWSVLKFWVPVLVWMAVIFAASSDSGSFGHTSRLIGPVMRWLFPGASDQVVHHVIVGVRKGAHLTEYAILALLVWRALPGAAESGASRWCWSRAALALAAAAVYAASDEFHQSFVPTREPSIWDVMLDTGGAACGLFLVWLAGNWRKSW